MSRWWVWLALVLGAGCSELPSSEPPAIDAGDAPRDDPPAARAAPPSEPPRLNHPPLAAGEEVSIPAGVLRVGSLPRTPGRDPRHEADLEEVTLGAFRIDRLPWPNDPTQRPTVGMPRAEAAAACQQAGKRLCTELEWERACKADGVEMYPSGSSFDVEACGLDPLSCASPFGVANLGVTVFEWTASDVSRGLGSDRYSAVVRGGRLDDPAEEHRCAARHAVAPDRGSREVGFRCCRGTPSDVAYPEEERLRSFRLLGEVDDARLREVLLTMPELAPYAADFALFDAQAVDRALGRGGHTREDVSWNLLEGVVRWAPAHGEHAWIFGGTGAGSSLVAVIHPMPDGSFLHGASFVLRDEPVPIAIAWDYGSKREVRWSACWGCSGEGGSVLYRDDHTIVIVQR